MNVNKRLRPYLVGKNGETVPYTMIPLSVIRSKTISVYDKIILIEIMSCGDDSFPSYEKLMEWTGLSRERVWKSLRTLVQRDLVYRFKKGKIIHYVSYWRFDAAFPKEERILKWIQPDVSELSTSKK